MASINKKKIALIEKYTQEKLRNKAMKLGVTLKSPETVFLSADTKFGKNITIHPYVMIGQKVKIGSDVEILPFSHIENATFLISYSTMFLVLMSLGVALSNLKIVSFKESLIFSFIRIIIGPLIGFGFVKFFNLSGIEAGVMFIQTSMPSAVLTYLIGKMYSPKSITDNIASTVVLSTFLSFITIPMVVFFALKYF